MENQEIKTAFKTIGVEIPEDEFYPGPEEFARRFKQATRLIEVETVTSASTSSCRQ